MNRDETNTGQTWTPPLTQCERASMWRFKQWRGWKRAPGAVSTDVERSVFATAVIAVARSFPDVFGWCDNAYAS